MKKEDMTRRKNDHSRLHKWFGVMTPEVHLLELALIIIGVIISYTTLSNTVDAHTKELAGNQQEIKEMNHKLDLLLGRFGVRYEKLDPTEGQ